MSNPDLVWAFLQESLDGTKFQLCPNDVNLDPSGSVPCDHYAEIKPVNYVPYIVDKNNNSYPWRFKVKYIDYGKFSGQIMVYTPVADCWPGGSGKPVVKVYNLADPECVLKLIDLLNQHLKFHLDTCNLRRIFGKAKPFKCDRSMERFLRAQNLIYKKTKR